MCFNSLEADLERVLGRERVSSSSTKLCLEADLEQEVERGVGEGLRHVLTLATAVGARHGVGIAFCLRSRVQLGDRLGFLGMGVKNKPPAQRGKALPSLALDGSYSFREAT